jgi:hypothetical protein
LNRGVDEFDAAADTLEPVVGERTAVGAGVEFDRCSALGQDVLVAGDVGRPVADVVGVRSAGGVPGAGRGPFDDLEERRTGHGEDDAVVPVAEAPSTDGAPFDTEHRGQFTGGRSRSWTAKHTWWKLLTALFLADRLCGVPSTRLRRC